MEKQFFVEEKGQALLSQDLDLMGETAALADDRVLAELLRLAPFDIKGDSVVAKGVLASGYTGGSGNHPWAGGPDNYAIGNRLVGGRGIDVFVRPFRAIVGSREGSQGLEPLEPLKNWRDIRTGLCIGGRVHIEAADTDPRWDLVYARVDIDIKAEGVTRLVKDPSSMVVMPKTIAPCKITKVTLGIEKGREDVSPLRPDPPPDAANAYYIPLAYVRVTSGGIKDADIWEIAPVVTLAQSVGGNALKPANHQYKPGGRIVTGDPWTATAGQRPATYMPPTMVGGESRIIKFEVAKHGYSGTVDDSVDWRRRFFRVMATWGSSGQVPNAHSHSGSAHPLISALGQTIVGTSAAVMGDGSQTWELKVDSTTGALKVEGTTTSDTVFFAWLEASAQYEW